MNYDKRHIDNINAYAKQIDSAFVSVIRKIDRLVKNPNLAKFKDEFTFDTHQYLSTEAKAVFNEFNSEVESILRTGISNEWDLANVKNNALVNKVLSQSVIAKAPELLSTNIKALEAFTNRQVNGISLSDRVWNITKGFKEEVEVHIGMGLATGESADVISRRVRQYLKNPNALFRRVRDKDGNLQLSKNAKNYHPGRGTYRSAYKNARRLAVTETNIAYHLSDSERWQQMDFIVGYEVVLSNQHSVDDMCDPLAGRYPKNFIFSGWHPHCLCHAVPVLLNDQEFKDYQQSILNGEKYDATKSANFVGDVPKGYKSWIKDNTNRINNAKSTPFFIKDNYHNGLIKNGLKINANELSVNIPSANSSKYLSQLPQSKPITNANVGQLIKLYALDFAGEFNGGLSSFQITNKDDAFMANSRHYRSSGYAKELGNSISVSDYDFKLGDQIFNPATELKGAIEAIRKNKTLSFNQEYALESLWHEIRHAGAVGWSKLKSKTNSLALSMETINQYCARYSYDDFVKKLGGNASNQIAIKQNGFGYNHLLKNFNSVLEKYKIDKSETYNYFKDLIQTTPYENIQSLLIKYFENNNVKNANDIVKNIYLKETEFKRLMDE